MRDRNLNESLGICCGSEGAECAAQLGVGLCVGDRLKVSILHLFNKSIDKYNFIRFVEMASGINKCFQN